MKKIFYDEQEIKHHTTLAKEDLNLNKQIIDSICSVGDHLSHDIYENSELDKNVNVIETIENWMNTYFEDVQDGSIKILVYLKNLEFYDNKRIMNFVCETTYSIMDISNSKKNEPVFELVNKIKFHTED